MPNTNATASKKSPCHRRAEPIPSTGIEKTDWATYSNTMSQAEETMYCSGLRDLKHGRWPAASAVGSSRKKSSGAAVGPDVPTTTLEGADADEPVLRLPPAAAQGPIVTMYAPAAIAHEGAALGDSAQFAERVDAILQGPGCLGHGGLGRLRPRPGSAQFRAPSTGFLSPPPASQGRKRRSGVREPCEAWWRGFIRQRHGETT